MLRQNHRWTTTLSLAAALALMTWVLAQGLDARLTAQRVQAEAQGIAMFEFQRLHERGQVLVVDVRDRASYEAGRIAGAVHVSVNQIAAMAHDLSRRAQSRLIVTYCACPAESSSLRAARLLADVGVPSRALIGGYLKWVDAGGRVERGAPPRE